MVPVTSSSSTPKTSFDFMKNNTLYTPSSYLSSKEEVLVTTKKLMEPYKTQNMSINPKDEEMVKKGPEEIGVFGAEKYFNGDMDSDQSSSMRNPEVDAKHSLKKYTGTPSARSETSWNGQSVLLKNSLQEKKKNSGKIHKKKKNILSNLGCRCACSDGNSIDVDENISGKRSSDPNNSVPAARENEKQMNSSVKVNTDDKIKIQRKEERKSLQVFESPVDSEKKRIAVQKKLTSVPWESRTEEDEDTKSDTSSDLFEIESLKTKPKPSLNRQGSDPASPTCYAPSEVSIEWSIVTASAADFSVMSECATSPARRNRSSQIPRIPDPAKSALQRRGNGSGGGFLLSCKSLKSVRVSGDSERRSSMNMTSPIYVPSSETRRRISNSSPV